MLDVLKLMRHRLSVFGMALSAMVFGLVGQALAVNNVKAGELVDPAKEEVIGTLTELLPVIGVIFAIGFVIAWVIHRVRVARSG